MLQDNCDIFQDFMNVQEIINMMSEDLGTSNTLKLKMLVDDAEKTEYLISCIIAKSTKRMLTSFKQVCIYFIIF